MSVSFGIVPGIISRRQPSLAVFLCPYSRVPTQLTIIQDYANPLDRNGLPCGCSEEASELDPLDSLNPLGSVPAGQLPNELGRADVDETDTEG